MAGGSTQSHPAMVGALCVEARGQTPIPPQAEQPLKASLDAGGSALPNINKQHQDEASRRFDEARRSMGKLLPELPSFSEMSKANLAFALGVSPLLISAVNAVAVFAWPKEESVSVGLIVLSCLTAVGAPITGGSLGGRRARIPAARLGYLFGLAWIAFIVILVGGALVLKGVLEGRA